WLKIIEIHQDGISTMSQARTTRISQRLSQELHFLTTWKATSQLTVSLFWTTESHIKGDGWISGRSPNCLSRKFRRKWRNTRKALPIETGDRCCRSLEPKVGHRV